MKYDELIILLPCHSLEDFPVFHTGDDARSTLANWTAPWHPELVFRCGKMPQWHRVDSPPDETEQAIIFVPTICNDQLPTGFVDRMKSEGSVFIRNQIDRQAIADEIVHRTEDWNLN